MSVRETELESVRAAVKHSLRVLLSPCVARFSKEEATSLVDEVIDEVYRQP